MTEWSEAAKIAFGLMVSAFVVTLLAYYFAVGRNINNEISLQDSNRELMKEYREYSGYNNKVVYAQDVVSLVLEKRGTIAIRVTTSGNTTSYWADDWAEQAVETNPTDSWVLPSSARRIDYTSTAVNEHVNLNKSYKGTITYGGNGEVLGVTFASGDVDAGGNFTED